MNFEGLADAASGSIIVIFGEAFSILDLINPSNDPLPVKGVFDETLNQAVDTEIPVYIESPNILMRDEDSQGRLDKRKFQIRRESTSEVFKIVDLLRDEISTTRYILEKIDG